MKKLVVLLGLVFTAAACFAAPVTVLFTAFQSPGWWVGYPYTATINGLPGISVMCDDYDHGGLPGQTWQANVTDLGTGNLSLVRFNQLPNAATLYNEAGWLLLQTEVTPSTQWTDINTAVWWNFDPSTPLTIGAQNWLSLANKEANLGFPGVNFHQVAIFTPVDQYDLNTNGPQELLKVVPEPTSIVLLAGGLVGLLARKKFL